jgi:glycosyltransferase involved in cell wall biosynthesis
MDREAARNELELSGDAPVVTFMGRLSVQKGVDHFLAAAGNVLQTGQDVAFVVAGDGPQRAILEAQSADLGLDQNVRFLGYRSDSASVLRASDIVVLPSRAEGLPVVLLEALAVGCPVIATRVGGIPDLVRHGHTGLLIQPNAPQQLSAAMQRLLSDPGLAARLGNAGRAHVVSAYAPERAARRMASVYRTVLAERL